MNNIPAEERRQDVHEYLQSIKVVMVLATIIMLISGWMFNQLVTTINEIENRQYTHAQHIIQHSVKIDHLYENVVLLRQIASKQQSQSKE